MDNPHSLGAQVAQFNRDGSPIPGRASPNDGGGASWSTGVLHSPGEHFVAVEHPPVLVADPGVPLVLGARVVARLDQPPRLGGGVVVRLAAVGGRHRPRLVAGLAVRRAERGRGVVVVARLAAVRGGPAAAPPRGASWRNKYVLNAKAAAPKMRLLHGAAPTPARRFSSRSRGRGAPPARRRPSSTTGWAARTS